MHFFLIDPAKGSIKKITGKPTLQQQYKLLGCDLIDVVRLAHSTDVFVVDDEGLFKNPMEATIVNHGKNEVHIDQGKDVQAHQLVGRIIYIGTTYEGDTAEPENAFQFHAITKPMVGTEIIAYSDISKPVQSRIYWQFLLARNAKTKVPWDQTQLELVPDKGYQIKEITLEQALKEADPETTEP